MSGRKPLAPAENRLPELAEDAAPRLAELQSQAALVKQEQQASALMSAGGIRALSFTQTILDVVQLAEYENIKKSKTWREMVNPETQTYFGNLDEWCRHYLGKTYERMRQISANRNLIGQEAFEQAERIGLRQVDYNAIKALPAPDQELVRRAVEESTSRDEVLDLLQELAARHGQEKQALTRRAEEAQADLAAQKELLDKKNARIDKLERDLSRIRHLPPDEALKKLQQEAAAITADAEGLILGGVRQGLLALSQEDGNQSVFMAGLLGQLQARLNALREEFNLPDTSAAHDAEMAAKVAAWAPPANAAASAA